MGTNGEDDAFWAKLDLSDFEETKGNGANNLMIYSNPNNGIFNVDVPLEAMNEKQLTLKIFDNSNRLVKQENLDMTEEAFNVEVPEYKPGIYFLQLISKKRTYTGKMIVQ